MGKIHCRITRSHGVSGTNQQIDCLRATISPTTGADNQELGEDKEDSTEKQQISIQYADDDEMKQMMAFMDSSLSEQDSPKVGIFWYSPEIHDVFGVVAIDADVASAADKRDMVTCKELHINIWKEKSDYFPFHDGSNLYVGDYKYTPRGRIFYIKSVDDYRIMAGSRINDYPEAIEKIKIAFNLNKESLNVRTLIGERWEIGMGYGD